MYNITFKTQGWILYDQCMIPIGSGTQNLTKCIMGLSIPSLSDDDSECVKLSFGK